MRDITWELIEPYAVITLGLMAYIVLLLALSMIK